MDSVYNYELYHHGVKGQKWGVRRYQYKDGSLTPAGRKRYNNDSGSSRINAEVVSKLMSTKVKDLVNTARTQITGRQYVDGYLKKGTTFARIQTTDVFEKFAFYATYKKDDVDLYAGLFGRSLTRRAEKAGEETPKIYQLKLETTKKLKIPSDEHAADITAKLLKEPEFKENFSVSLADSKQWMIRPSQQVLLKQAENAMKKNPDKLTNSEKIALYKALNLTLVNHNNAQEIAAQNRFYAELKKKGYDALLDYNDKDYSSYHAKRPMIVFDVDSVTLKSVTETSPQVINTLYKKYNTRRIAKETVANTLGLVSKIGTKTVSECDSYVRGRVDSYLSDSKSKSKSKTKSKSQIVNEYKKKHPNTRLSNADIVNNYTG